MSFAQLIPCFHWLIQKIIGSSGENMLRKWPLKKITEDSRPCGSFFTQVDHLFLATSFSKPVINPADSFTLKISEQLDHWLKSYCQKVNFLLTKSKLFGHNFWTSGQIEPKFEYGKISRIVDLFAKAVCRSKVVNLGEKWLTWAMIYCSLNPEAKLQKNTV